MKVSGTTCLHLACDHGHRADQDSLVKGWSYAARNKSGDRVINFLYSDIDQAGHSSEQAVDALETSFKRIKLLVPDVKLISSEGDAGGGGAVQCTHKGLAQKQVMDAWARFINCLLHALSKCLENAC